MKLIAVVVAYYPDLTEAILNIHQYIDFVDQLIIWENTPIKDRSSHKIVLTDNEDKVIYLGTDKNEGIAYALNRSIEWAINRGYTHILTMDQDSFFYNFDSYKRIINKNLSEQTLTIYSPNTNDMFSTQSDVVEVEYSITSGSIFNLSIFDKIGLFREDFFIDAVDLEFCIRAKRRYNYSTFIVCNAHLKQSFGNLDRTTIGFKSNNYSAFRTFFIARNNIWLWKEYPEIHSYQMFKFLFGESIFKRPMKILLGESDKYSKFKSLFKGIYLGLIH